MKYGGTYALVMALGRDLGLSIGKLGVRSLPAGHYVYVGSALGGLHGRLRYHLRREKRLHWHIDYLLRRARVAQIWRAPGQDRLECRWNVILQGLPGATPSVPGFGASDCRCSSHLTRFWELPPFDLFAQRLEEAKLPQAQQIIGPGGYVLVKDLINMNVNGGKSRHDYEF